MYFTDWSEWGMLQAVTTVEKWARRRYQRQHHSMCHGGSGAICHEWEEKYAESCYVWEIDQGVRKIHGKAKSDSRFTGRTCITIAITSAVVDSEQRMRRAWRGIGIENANRSCLCPRGLVAICSSSKGMSVAVFGWTEEVRLACMHALRIVRIVGFMALMRESSTMWRVRPAEYVRQFGLVQEGRPRRRGSAGKAMGLCCCRVSVFAYYIVECDGHRLQIIYWEPRMWDPG